MSDLRALTVRQPWAQAIVVGAKPIENRSQGFPMGYRGPLAIHAGKGWSVRGARDERIVAAFGEDPWRFALKHVPAYGGRPPHPFLAGVILAVVDLVDVHPASGCCEPWGEETYPPANPEGRPPGRVTHLVFEDVRRLVVPIAAKGRLGLWRPDDEVTAELARVA